MQTHAHIYFFLRVSSLIYVIYFRLGLDAKILANVVNSSTGRCWSSDLYNPVPGILPNVPSSKNYEVIECRMLLRDLVFSLHCRFIEAEFENRRNYNIAKFSIIKLIAHIIYSEKSNGLFISH